MPASSRCGINRPVDSAAAWKIPRWLKRFSKRSHLRVTRCGIKKAPASAGAFVFADRLSPRDNQLFL
jgi:hypothetical protein